MKNNKTIKFTTALVLLIGVFAGCVKDQDFSTPSVAWPMKGRETLGEAGLREPQVVMAPRIKCLIGCQF